MNSKRKQLTSAAMHVQSEFTKKQKVGAVPMSTIAITDLNDDCLMQIFSKFSIKGLVNVAEAHISLLTSAENVFQRNYIKTVVEVSNQFDPKLEDQLFSAKVIKYFGSKITKLKVVYLTKYCRYDGVLEDMILDQCTDVLAEIEIENGDQLVFHKIDKPFQKLRKISFINSDVPDVLLNFEKWFPMTNALELKQ